MRRTQEKFKRTRGQSIEAEQLAGEIQYSLEESGWKSMVTKQSKSTSIKSKQSKTI
jgi:hypothetical protein